MSVDCVAFDSVHCRIAEDGGMPVMFEIELRVVSSEILGGVTLDFEPCMGGGGGGFRDLNSVSDIGVGFSASNRLRSATSIFSVKSSSSRLLRFSMVRFAMSWASMS